MTLLQGRYQIQREIGRGSQGITYQGLDQQTGRQVAIKALHLSRLEDWKALELFEREAQALRSIEHPAVPAYLDAFQQEEAGDTQLYLVQAFIQGRDLKERLEQQGRSGEAHIEAVLRHLLPALAQLHDRVPPVIHRDIKPSNILEDEQGQHHLVDFGAVQVASQSTVGGSTVIGTPGFMPLEQLVGRASPASDLYSLGVTLCVMWTGVDPTEVPMRDNKLLYEDLLPMDRALARTLVALIEPSSERRPSSAAALLASLDRAQAPEAPAPEAPLGVEEWHHRAEAVTASWALGFGVRAQEGSREDLEALGMTLAPEREAEQARVLRGWTPQSHCVVFREEPQPLLLLAVGDILLNDYDAFSYWRSPDGATLCRFDLGQGGGVRMVSFLEDGRSIATGEKLNSSGVRPGDVRAQVQGGLEAIARRHQQELDFALRRGARPLLHVPTGWAWAWERAALLPSDLDNAQANLAKLKQFSTGLKYWLHVLLITVITLGALPLLFTAMWLHKSKVLKARYALFDQPERWRPLPSPQEQPLWPAQEGAAPDAEAQPASRAAQVSQRA